ncbi:MAG: glycosyltransferase family 4 protein [Cyanobacteria bacterium]|nr:glycosyltransferase family 4 protein [Cyanobacteriota bacterium]
MKILIYSYNYAPEPIGIAPLMTELAEGLAARGHEVRVLTGMPNYPERQIHRAYRGKLYARERVNGVRIDRCYVRVRPKLGLVGRMVLDGSFVLTSFVRSLGLWRPDVILFTSPPLPVCVPAWILGKLKGCPTVLSLQDILPEAAVATGLVKSQKAIRVFEQLERFCYWSADAIVAIAEGFMDNLRDRKGIAADKIELIYNWADVDTIVPMDPDTPFRRDNGLSGKFVALYAGNIALTQGIETVVKAAALLKGRPEAETVRFVIVGMRERLAELQTLCRDKGVEDLVILREFVPPQERPQMLAAADVGLVVQKRNVVAFNMPSKTQGIMASGRAIVASVPLTGTAARAVTEAKAGVVVPPEDPQALLDAVLALHHDRDRAIAYGKAGRQWAEAKYSYATALDRYEALFQRLAKGV